MGVYKTSFCKIGYNDVITTASDPEHVCSGLGLNGNGVYTFPVAIPSPLTAASTYTRTYFISSDSISDTAYHNYDEGIMIDEDQHGSVGAMEVKISGLNISYGISSEIVKLNGNVAVQLANHYHRINEIKVVTTGRLLSNIGNIYVSALNRARTGTLLKLEDFEEDGIPGASQYVYAKILESENRMLSCHYTVPRSHTLYIESLQVLTDVATICNWVLQAGVNGSLHTILKSRSTNNFNAQSKSLTFNTPYTFPAGSDIILKITTVGGTTDVTSIMEGYLISQEKLELENTLRKSLEGQVLITRYEELNEQAFVESDYKDEEFSDIPGYGGLGREREYDASSSKYEAPSDAEAYEEDCPPGYKWCDVLSACIDSRSDCTSGMLA